MTRLLADPDRFDVPKEPYVSLDAFQWRRGEASLYFRPSTYRRPVFWARNAIFHAIRLLGIAPADQVLVPAYICAAAVDPIIAAGAEVVFFRVDRQCNPDLADIERRITVRTRALVVVHYFGYPQPLGLLRKLCDQRRLLLIEDCAHVLLGEVDGMRLGSVGDASVFSWRKFMPLHDGGALVMNRPVPAPPAGRGEPWLFTLKAAKSLIDRRAASVGGFGLVAAQRWLARARRWTIRSEGSRSLAALPDPLRLSFDASMADFPMSRLSRLMLSHAAIDRIVRRRRANATSLLQKLKVLPAVRPLFPHLPLGLCPWVLPVIFDGVMHAHRALRNRGVPAATWGDVRPAGVPATQFPDADFLYENVVFLPIHQNLREAQLRRIAETVANVCPTEFKHAAADAAG